MAWYYWNTNYAESSAGYTITSNSTTDSAWHQWHQWNYGRTSYTTSGNVTTASASGPNRAVVVPTPEQIRRDREESEQRAAAARERAERERLEKEEAMKKATRILVANLGPTQRRTFKQGKYFVVRSRSGKSYRVNYGRAQNIKLLDSKGNVLRTYCIHPLENVPTEDTMLAQKLMIQHDEEAFLRIANVS